MVSYSKLRTGILTTDSLETELKYLNTNNNKAHHCPYASSNAPPNIFL